MLKHILYIFQVKTENVNQGDSMNPKVVTMVAVISFIAAAAGLAIACSCVDANAAVLGIPMLDPHTIPMLDPHTIPMLDPHTIPMLDPH